MKKLLFIASLLISNSAFAQLAHEILLNKRNATNTTYVVHQIHAPFQNGVFWWDNANKLPKWATLGTGLSVNGSGQLVIGGISTASLSLSPWQVDFFDNQVLPHHNHDAGDIVTGVLSASRIPALEIHNTNHLQDSLDGKASLSHSHVSTAISDSTAVGRSVLTASTTADARTAIGAGTSNFDGTFGGLTGTPLTFTPSAHNQAWSTITLTPTTLSGYGITDADSAGAAAAAQAYAVQRVNHTGIQSADTITDGTTNKAYTASEKTKLSGVATGATANDTDANLKNRGNHTGTQSADTLTDGATNRLYSSAEKTKLSGIAAGATVNTVYSGTTNASGIYAVTYPSAYASKPKLTFSVEGGTNKDTSVLTSTTTTGFSIIVERRTDVLGLLPSYAPVNGLTVNVLVSP